MSRRKAPKMVRLNLEVDPSVRERLLKLQRATGAATMTETFRRALSAYELLVKHQRSGGHAGIFLRDRGGTAERLWVVP